MNLDYRKIKNYVVLAICCPIALFARWTGLRPNIVVETGYDTNPALLTCEDIDLFEAGDPNYMDLESTDDGYLRIGGDLSYRFKLSGIKAEAGILYRYTRYFLNLKRLSLHLVRDLF